jgi:hypothetical protein
MGQQLELTLRRSGRHPQCPQPHWVQLTQPEARASGPAHSGQTLMEWGGAG